MNRSSLRMKQYRPVSADFTKLSGSLSSMFTNDNEKPASNNVLLITYKKSVSEVEGSPPVSPCSTPFIRSYTSPNNTNTNTPDNSTKLDNNDTPIIENCNGNGNGGDTVVDCSVKETPNNNNNNIKINGVKKNNKLERFKSLSSAGSWESEDDCPPLASEDSDVGDHAEFESFSGTEDDEDDDESCSLSVTIKSDESRLSFLKRRSLREKLRDTKTWSLRRSSEKELSPSPGTGSSTSPSHNDSCSESRLSRLFSLRRSLGGPGSNVDRSDQCMPRVAEEDEAGAGCKDDSKQQSAPSLPPPPMFLTAEQTKRRHIINSLVHSENNYLSSLRRLVQDYKLPLEESNPPILSQAKVDILFHKLQDILDIHSQFREALTKAVPLWDKEEKIGDVFVSCFSKSIVLEIYSDFINNFNQAMELAKSESKRKSAFADFLKVKQITASDRLNFFGLMVKPIQRFPQFILLLQDLLKETPQGHNDRMALQLALTTLESVAVMLNERKRESEQAAAFHAKLRNGGSKLGKSEHARVLLREDDVHQLEFNSFGQVCRSKPRRLLLLNDQVVCAAVSGRVSEAGEVGQSITSSAGERLNVKWAAGVEEVELVEGSSVGTLARLTVAGSVSSSAKRSSLGRSLTPASLQQFNGSDSGQAENLAQDMADLMHDFDVVSRISSLIGTLKCPYPALTTDLTADILSQIQTSIRQKDEEMSWLDKSCLHLAVRKKDKIETMTFQMRSPTVKDDWVVEHRLSRLALDPNNSPGWDIQDQSQKTPNTNSKLPLFVKNVLVPQGPQEIQTEITAGTSYTLQVPTPTRSLRPVTYVWVNASHGKSSHLRIYSAQMTQQINLKELGTVVLSSCSVKAVVHVPGLTNGVVTHEGDNARADMVWIATDDHRILFYSAADPERGTELGRLVLDHDIMTMVCHQGQVWVAMASGSVAIIRRGLGGGWDTHNMVTASLGPEAVTCLLPGGSHVYCSTGRRVVTVDNTGHTGRCFTLTSSSDNTGDIGHMAVAGVGLWVSLANSSVISLYHTESFIHMRDIDVASNVNRVLTARDNIKRSVHVTALSAAKGLLWIGTNVGIALTIPLPRLEGVPIVSGKANISYHAHFGPVRMFLSLTTSVVTSEAPPLPPVSRRPSNSLADHKTIEEEPSQEQHHHDHKQYLRKQVSDGHLLMGTGPGPSSLSKQYSSPMLGTRRPREAVRDRDRESVTTTQVRRTSKTLPRGFSLSQAMAEGADSVYGLYGDLLNVRDYECDSTDLGRACQENHKSDPELDTIQYRVSTLDRRVTMKSQRPRSLDLSSWSVESRTSSHTTSSSDTCSDFLTSPSLSRNASFVSNRSAYEPMPPSHATSTVAAPPPPSVRRRMSCKKAGNVSQSQSPKQEASQRTVTTLMGGRGYIQWRAAQVERHKTSHLAQINNSDAYLVIWDHKL